MTAIWIKYSALTLSTIALYRNFNDVFNVVVEIPPAAKDVPPEKPLKDGGRKFDMQHVDTYNHINNFTSYNNIG